MLHEKFDQRFMAAALAIGRQGLGRTAPNPAVGAVLAKEESHGPVIVGAGRTADGGRPHAERVALQMAGARAAGATCYVTLEPCSHFGKSPPCANALVAAGVSGVVVATLDPNPAVAGGGLDVLADAGIGVRLGVRRHEAEQDLAGHLSRMRRKRPHVTLKLAVAADGAIGRRGEGQIAISCPASGRHVHLLRAENDGIAVGIGTVLSDDPTLTCRLPGMFARSPHRIVLDTEARTPPTAKLFDAVAQVPVIIVVGIGADTARVEALEDAGADVIAVSRTGRHVDLHAALNALGGLGLTRILAEGGAAVAGALAAAGLIDEAYVITAAKRVGGTPVRPFDGQAISALRPQLPVMERTLVEADVWTHMLPPCLPASSQTLAASQA